MRKMENQKQMGKPVLPQTKIIGNTKTRRLSSSPTITDYWKESSFHNELNSSLKDIYSIGELTEQSDKIIAEFNSKRNKKRLSEDSDSSDQSSKYLNYGHVPTSPPVLETIQELDYDEPKQKVYQSTKSVESSSSSVKPSVSALYYKRKIDKIPTSMNVLYSERELLERNALLKKIKKANEMDTKNVPRPQVHVGSNRRVLPPVQSGFSKVSSLPLQQDRITKETTKLPPVPTRIVPSIKSAESQSYSKISNVRPVSTMASLAVLFSERELNERAERMGLRSKLSYLDSGKPSATELSDRDTAIASLAVLFSKRELEEMAEDFRRRSELQHLDSTSLPQPDTTNASLVVNYSEKDLMETSEKMKMRSKFSKRDSFMFGQPAVKESTPDIYSEKELSEIAQKMRKKRKLSPPIEINTRSLDLLAPNLTRASLAVLYSERELADINERMKMASERGAINLTSDKSNEYKKYSSSASPSVVVMYSEKELEDSRKRFRASTSYGTISNAISPMATKENTLQQHEEINDYEETIDVVVEKEKNWDNKTPISLSSGPSGFSGWETIGCSPEVWDSVKRPGNGVLDYSRFVLDDEEFNGLLTGRIIATGQSCLDRIPGTRGYVYTKLELQGKLLSDISVLKCHRYLQYLDLSWNQLSDVSALGDIKHLKCLDLSHNELYKLLEFKAPWFLTHVNYSYNFVQNIDDISEFWSLKVLDLSHNNIKRIEGLQNLKYLQILNLSFNEIKTLENLNAIHLGVLYLENNVIEDYKDDLSPLADLKYLNLSDNLLTSLGFLRNVSSLRSLDIRNNKIADLAEIENLTNLTSLEVVNLSENQITTWPNFRSAIIALLPHLVLLDNIHVSVEEKISAKIRFFPDIETQSAWDHARNILFEKYTNPLIDLDVKPVDQPVHSLVVLVGPPASGKSELLIRVSRDFKDKLYIGIAHTTREPPKNTKPENLQYYLTLQQFNNMYARGEFLTTSVRLGYNYGFSRNELAKAVRMGCLCITDMWLCEALTLFATGIQPCFILTLIEDEYSYLIKLATDFHANKLVSVFRPRIDHMSKTILRRPESYKISRKIVKDILEQAMNESCVNEEEADILVKGSETYSDEVQDLGVSEETSEVSGCGSRSLRDNNEVMERNEILNNSSKPLFTKSRSGNAGGVQIGSNSQIKIDNSSSKILPNLKSNTISNENTNAKKASSKVRIELSKHIASFERKSSTDIGHIRSNVSETLSGLSEAIPSDRSEKRISKESYINNIYPTMTSSSSRGLPVKMNTNSSFGSVHEVLRGIHKVSEEIGSILFKEPSSNIHASSEQVIYEEKPKINEGAVPETTVVALKQEDAEDSTKNIHNEREVVASSARIKDATRSKIIQKDADGSTEDNIKGVAVSFSNEVQDYFQSKISYTSKETSSSESQLIEEFSLNEDEESEEPRPFQKFQATGTTSSLSAMSGDVSQIFSAKSLLGNITVDERIDKIVFKLGLQFKQEYQKIHLDNPGLFEISIYIDDLDEATCKLKKFLTSFIAKGKKHPTYYPKSDPAYKTFVLGKTNKFIESINRSKSVMAQQQYEILHPKRL